MPPFVIGHAAAAGEAPANTLAGVRASLDAGAEAMEIDVQLSADAVPVLLHDDTLDRTTNLTGPVRNVTAARLQAADAGGGEPVPTLAQVLDLVAGRLTVLCELKATPGDPAQDEWLVDQVLATIDAAGACAWTGVHSFSLGIVARARAAQPSISAAIISPAVDGDALERLLTAALKRNAQAVSIEHTCVDADLVRRAKQRQLTVWTWTADRPGDWARLAAAGVDGIITNVPHELRAWLDR
ncbi:MAG: hypothetical protein HYX53_14790 [Chloroflexi bacterium]|nr:hypothetical protein [Chloroflexota bacterium]